ncbi:MAG: hypothetical protein LW849_07645, partial [Burkholderiales bacterium]|nr:hypothetical protein [Burkholderiales bacterium]
AADFYAALMNRQPVKKFTASLPEITMGHPNYLQLIDIGVAEFSERSIICLDSDTADKVAKKKRKTIVLLPGHLPPDQLIFEHLYNLLPNDGFWQNDSKFTRSVFTNVAAEVINEFAIRGDHVDLKKTLEAYTGVKTPREVFKRFYKDIEFQKLLGSLTNLPNPWKHWIQKNPEATNDFLQKFEHTIRRVMADAYAVDINKLVALKVKLKKA